MRRGMNVGSRKSFARFKIVYGVTEYFYISGSDSVRSK